MSFDRPGYCMRLALSCRQRLSDGQGVGKTFALANELLEQIKAQPEQPFFIFDWSGGLIDTLLMLALSDSKREEIRPRLIYDAMGGREINGNTYVMPMPEFSEKYDPGKSWLERVEDQADRVQRTFEALNPNLVELNPTVGGRPIIRPSSESHAIGQRHHRRKRQQLADNRSDKASEQGNSGTGPEAIWRQGGQSQRIFCHSIYRQRKLSTKYFQLFSRYSGCHKVTPNSGACGLSDPGWTPNEAIRQGSCRSLRRLRA